MTQTVSKTETLFTSVYMESLRRAITPSVGRRLCISVFEPCTGMLPEFVLGFDGKRFSQTLGDNASSGIEKTDGDLLTLSARVRTASGSRAAAKLRESGRVPGTLFSGIGSSHEQDRILLSFDKRDIVSVYHKVGSYGWGCLVCNVIIQDDESGLEDSELIRALGRQIHVTAATAEPENVTMIGFPSDRAVKVNVPLKIFGREVSPGIRAGGRVNWIRRTIPCLVEGSASVPQFFEVDISDLEVNDKILWTSLELPSGVKILLKDPKQPVLKMARK